MERKLHLWSIKHHLSPKETMIITSYASDEQAGMKHKYKKLILEWTSTADLLSLSPSVPHPPPPRHQPSLSLSLSLLESPWYHLFLSLSSDLRGRWWVLDSDDGAVLDGGDGAISDMVALREKEMLWCISVAIFGLWCGISDAILDYNEGVSDAIFDLVVVLILWVFSVSVLKSSLSYWWWWWY